MFLRPHSRIAPGDKTDRKTSHKEVTFLTEKIRRLSGAMRVNPFTDTLINSQSNGPLYSNAVIGRLAVDGWAEFGTTRRGLGGLRPRPVPFSLY